MGQKKRRNRKSTSSPRGSIALTCEAEILPGLQAFAKAEITQRLGKRAIFLLTERSDHLGFHYTGNISHLSRLHTVVAVYRVEHFAIPRPRALLGHQHFQRLITAIKAVIAPSPEKFHTFRLSAAGKESAIFTRLKSSLQQHLQLTPVADEADLLIRIRPALLHTNGWEVLIRFTPRPLSVRKWRVNDMPGALNATVAAAMIELTQPHKRDRFLNLMCGSGTLLIERLNRCRAECVVGGDISFPALSRAHRNCQAAGLAQLIPLINLDAIATPLPTAHFNVICADLPWGQLIGSHRKNAELYPNLLQEAARLAIPRARLVLLTHEIKLLDRIINQSAIAWQLKKTIQVYQGGLHPKLYLLEKLA